MKTVMISIYKKHNENIFDTLLKTEEIRKVKPKGIECPFKCVVYEPKKFGGCGKVIGEFIVDRIEAIKTDMLYSTAEKACITKEELFNYLGVIPNSNFNDYNWGYSWHITAPKLYEKPKELGEFYSIKQCKPEYSPFGYQWTWEDRHKRNTGGWDKKYRPVPIECHRCKSLVGGKDYLDEKSGCILFDYECVSNYHKPLARPPQSYMRIQDPEED